MAKILIIDDDAGLAKMVRDFLTAEKHEVEARFNGSEGYALLTQQQFDLLVVDWDMPGMTGVEICKAYRATGGAIPILMLTGRTDFDEKELALDAGADDYLTKPFNAKELGARVRAMLRRSGLSSQPPAPAQPQQPQYAADLRVCVVCSGTYSANAEEKCPDDGGATIALCTQSTLGKDFGGYRASRLLGAGAWSEVYLGFLNETRTSDDRAAIKLLHSHLASDPVKVARFEREARALLAIQHPKIARIVSFGRSEDGRPFIAMEYVEGQSIESYIRQIGPFTTANALRLSILICEALEAAHSKGIIHRDIKPSNIFFDSSAGGTVRTVKLMDFGLAKAVTTDGGALASLTRDGEIMGTPAYMSPEQIKGDRLDERSDIYALGCVMYEMLAGTRPFAGNSAFEVMTQHLTSEPEPLQTRNPNANVSPEFDQIIARALLKDPDDRFQSAAELHEALQQVSL